MSNRQGTNPGQIQMVMQVFICSIHPVHAYARSNTGGFGRGLIRRFRGSGLPLLSNGESTKLSCET